MGSKTFDGVRFSAYPLDHDPPHFHGDYGEVRVILQFHFDARAVRLANRRDRVKPANAKRSDIQRIISAAKTNFDALVILWKAAHP